MKTIRYIFLLFPFFIYSQNEEELFAEAYYQSARTENDLSQFYSFPILDLPNNDKIDNLKRKLVDDINTVASCSLFYAYAEYLKLNDQELKLLEERITQIAQGFCRLKRYTVFQNTGGYSPISGVATENKFGKEIFIVMSGGGCQVNKFDSRAWKITEMFNKEMENCIGGERPSYNRR
ncbi:MAG: hypothetical protein EOO99_12130 [Pedobacter sp.]|nr:MAG: hypothetical protein EOO99_12130 [Pedobacter sp.]